MKISFLFLVLISLNLVAQKTDFTSFPLSENPTNKELEFLRTELKGKQVVLLGENTHFEGNVFEYRNKIIQFLVKEMGFTTLAFESGVYDLYKANQEIEQGEDVRYALQNGVMKHWAYAKEFYGLYSLAKQEQSRLKFIGFDSQLQSFYAQKHFIDDFKTYARDMLAIQLEKDFINQLKLVLLDYTIDEKGMPYTALKEKLTLILSKISSIKPDKKYSYWYQIIKGILKVLEDVNLYPDNIITLFVLTKTDEIRDAQMADNLLTYIKHHPKDKIICLGANAHFFNNLSNVDEPSLKQLHPMGSYLKNQLNDALYTLAFVTSCRDVPNHPKSIEYSIEKKITNHSFVSTNQPFFKTARYHSLLSNGMFIKSPIQDFFDGFITFKSCVAYTSGEKFKSSQKSVYEITGKVINSSTKEPLVYALIKIPNTNIAAFTDEMGNYKLLIPRTRHIDKVAIEYYGATTVTVTYKPLLEVNLIEKINRLDEVVIKARKSGKSIVLKAIENKWNNHLKQKKTYSRHCKATWKEDDHIYLDFEFTIDEKNRFKKNKNRVTNTTIHYNTGRVAKDSLRNLPYYRWAFNYPVLQKRNIDAYNFTYVKDTIINNQMAYKVVFDTEEKSSSYTHNYSLTHYKGVLYIAKKEAAFLKMEHYWDMAGYDTKVLESLWYVPYRMKKNRVVRTLKISFDFEKEAALYHCKKTVTELFGYYIDDGSKQVQLYTTHQSDMKLKK